MKTTISMKYVYDIQAFLLKYGYCIESEIDVQTKMLHVNKCNITNSVLFHKNELTHSVMK